MAVTDYNAIVFDFKTRGTEKTIDAFNRMQDEATDLAKDVTRQTTVTKRLDEKTGKYSETVRTKLTPTVKRFKFEFLGIMFAGMAIERAFKGITQAGMDMYGMGELINDAYGLTMLPIMDLLGDSMLGVIDTILNMSDEQKMAIGGALLMGQAFGGVLSAVGQLVLFSSSLQAMGGFGGFFAELNKIFTSLGAYAGKTLTTVLNMTGGDKVLADITAFGKTPFVLGGKTFTMGQAIGTGLAVLVMVNIAKKLMEGGKVDYADLFEIGFAGYLMGGWKGAITATGLVFTLGIITKADKDIAETKKVDYTDVFTGSLLGYAAGGWKGAIKGGALIYAIELAVASSSDAGSFKKTGNAIFDGIIGWMDEVKTKLKDYGLIGQILIGALDIGAGLINIGNTIGQSLRSGIIQGMGSYPGFSTSGLGDIYTGKGFAAYDFIKKLLGLADGGIVTKPTFAMIGESGPEAVVPLNKMSSMASTYYISPTINIDAKVSSDFDSRKLAEYIDEALYNRYRVMA